MCVFRMRIPLNLSTGSGRTWEPNVTDVQYASRHGHPVGAELDDSRVVATKPLSRLRGAPWCRTGECRSDTKDFSPARCVERMGMSNMDFQS
jgi:hypothetical protein